MDTAVLCVFTPGQAGMPHRVCCIQGYVPGILLSIYRAGSWLYCMVTFHALCFMDMFYAFTVHDVLTYILRFAGILIYIKKSAWLCVTLLAGLILH
jgi:hypothetical protein